MIGIYNTQLATDLGVQVWLNTSGERVRITHLQQNFPGVDGMDVKVHSYIDFESANSLSGPALGTYNYMTGLLYEYGIDSQMSDIVRESMDSVWSELTSEEIDTLNDRSLKAELERSSNRKRHPLTAFQWQVLESAFGSSYERNSLCIRYMSGGAFSIWGGLTLLGWFDRGRVWGTEPQIKQLREQLTYQADYSQVPIEVDNLLIDWLTT